ncbi:sialate O-acetylesterase [Muricoccus roseus]|nr:sialate O-acetylesterase [Roseomonas rosea]
MSIRAGVPEEAATKLVATNGAFGGRTLEMLSKGATPNEYGRMPTACEAVKREAERIGEPYRYLATLWLGGEHNYLDENGGSSDKAQYKAGLRRLVADLRSDCQCGIAQQAEPFAVFSYQAGCQFTRDGTNLSVGMAQWELSEEEPHWYLASPAYPVPDIGGHLSALGTAWLGQIFGKVMARVLLDGVRWRPLAPLMAVRHGRDVFVPYDVPVAPLAFRPTFLGRRSVMFPLKGFALIDDAGEVPLRFAEIVAPRVVRVELGRETSAEARPRLRYAGRRNYNGHGNLTDSDATLATANFRQDPAVTEEDEFASSLEGKPFPLWNWSIAYEIPIEEPSKSVLG